MSARAWIADGPGRAPGRVRAFFWSHPEWWCVVASALAWSIMLGHGLAHWGHAHHASMSPGDEWLHWMAMIAAMMLPLTLAPIRGVAFRSLRSRRHRAIALFVAGYFVPWSLLGLVAVAVRGMAWTHTHAVAAGAFVLAAAWACTPQHRRALVACHRTVPMAPAGLRADADALRSGLIVGNACTASCWAMMLACSVTGHGLPAMLGGAGIAAVERLSFRPRVNAVVGTTLLLAAGYAAAAIAGG